MEPVEEAMLDNTLQRRNLRCSVQPNLPAVAVCTTCMQAFSGRFLTARADGRAICWRCAANTGAPLLHPPERRPGDPALAGGFVASVRRLLLHPHAALGIDYVGSLMPALRFGLLCTMIGYALWMAWVFALDPDRVMNALPGWADADDRKRRLLLVSPWLAIPILASARLLAGTLLFHLGARLGGAPAGSLGTHARFFALTSATLLLAIIPAIGGLLSLGVWTSVALAWLRHTYMLPVGRAILAVLPASIVLTLIFGPGA